MNKIEEFENAYKIATDGGWRTKTEAEAWSVDFLRVSCDAGQDAAIDAANLLEAERTLNRVQQGVDHARCVKYRQEVYFDEQPIAEMSCRRDPSQLAKLEETATQLNCLTAVIEAGRLKNATEGYTHEEAEAIARQELELPKAKTIIAAASKFPDVYNKSSEELAKIARDMAPSNKSAMPDLYGKTQKEIQEAVDKL